MLGLLWLALLTRLGAEFGTTRSEHLILAAVIWLGAAALWCTQVLPFIGRSDDE